MSKGGKSKQPVVRSRGRLHSGHALPLVIAPDARLEKPAVMVDDIDDDVRELIANMVATMYEKGGCGLAAPQVGSNLRIFVMDTTWRDGMKSTRQPRAFVNPEIIILDGESIKSEEGCLSFPDLRIRVPRASHAVVDALDEEGRKFRFEARNDLAAMCVQHETDHLDGITMVDRLGPVAKARAMSEYKRTHAET